MARLQKKKTASKKTKKDNAAVAESSAEKRAVAVADKKTAARSVPATGEKRKKSPVPGKSAGAEPSAIMKLVEKYFGNWIQFFREVKVELAKVTWPTRKQTLGSTAVVIVFVFVIAFFLGIVDVGLSSLIRLIL